MNALETVGSWETAETRRPVTPEQLSILQHSLGLDQFGQGNSYRNHYCSDPTADLQALVDAGYMEDRGEIPMWGNQNGYTVTEAGREAIREFSPKPPPPRKTTRSQRRYRAFLRSETSSSFIDWVQSEYGKEVV